MFVVSLMRKLEKQDKVLVTTTEKAAVERLQFHFEQLAIKILQVLLEKFRDWGWAFLTDIVNKKDHQRF